MKRPFLVGHDYGMGGIWMYIDANSADEITRAYPELKVFETPPDHLTPEDLRTIESELHFDVEAPPSDYLKSIVDAREPG
jgi:hypothetical protein